MGVNNLWSILAPVKTHKPLKSLKGQTIAVDLSVWICESASALQGMPVVKPHLRNLFFRVTNLTQMGVNLIFVLDGEPPELKWDEMERRTKMRFEGGSRRGRRRCKRVQPRGGATARKGVEFGGKKKMKRTRFKFVVKECAEMLANLGIPCVQATGEAEAMCALLNKRGVVDACLTEDGDVFLYGARTVYKNFTLNTKDPHIERYSMDDIESQLGLDQSRLIALALLLGCDYTLGIPGIGQKHALRLMGLIEPGVDVLERFRDWADGRIPGECFEKAAPTKSPHCTKCTHVGSSKEHRVYGCAMCRSDIACHAKSVETQECTCPWHASSAGSKGSACVERDIMKKACAVEDFPSEPVIQEFLSTRDKCPRETLRWKRPQLISAQKFISAKLEWPEDYTVEKVFPLVTLWDLMAIASGHPFDPTLHVRPTAVVKKRVRQGVACVEIHWQTGIPHSELEFPTTIEREELFEKAFPELMRAFEEEKASKAKQKRKKAVKSAQKDGTEHTAPTSPPTASYEGDLDSLTSAVAELSLISQPSKSNEIIKSRLSATSESCNSSSNDHLHLSSGASSILPPRRNQRAKRSSKCKTHSVDYLLESSSLETSHSDPRNRVIAVEALDHEILPKIVRRKTSRPDSVSGSKGHERRPVVRNTNRSHVPSLSDVFDKECDDAKVLPFCRQPCQNKPQFASLIAKISDSSDNDDIDAEPLPLSERLKLKKALEVKIFEDSSSSSSVEENTDTAPLLVDASSVSEQLRLKNVVETESLEDSSSSVDKVIDITSALPADISSMVEQHWLKKALEAEFLDRSSLSGEEVADETSLQPEGPSSLLEQPQDKNVLKAESMEHSSSSSSSSLSSIKEVSDDTSSLPVDILSLSERFQLKKLLEAVSLEDSLSVSLVEEVSKSTSTPPVGALSFCERLQPKKIPKTKAVHDIPGLSSVEEVTDDSSSLPEDASSLMERLQVNKVLDTGSLEDSSSFLSEEELIEDTELPSLDVSSSFSSGSPSNVNFSLGFELTKLLSHDESLLQNEQVINLENVPDGEIQSPISFPGANEKRQRGEDQTSSSPTIPEETSNVGIPKELTICTQVPAETRKSREEESPIHSPPSSSPSTRYQPNFSLNFELTHILDGDLSVLRNEVNMRDNGAEIEQTVNANWRSVDNCEFDRIDDRIDVPMPTPPGNLCQTFAPLPIDVDTPSIVDQSSLKVSDQSEDWKPLKTKNPCQPIKTPVLHVPCQSKVLKLGKESRANHSPSSPLTSHSENMLHEEENSPVSLLDRLKRKHGNQKGVLSAVLSMKNGGKLGGKQEKDRKLLMEIFNDNDNKDDSVIFN